MPVRLIDLQLIYGVAGAREKFEELASHLVKGEQPSADKVRVERGDGGIDVHVGELTDPAGIEVYQCKFFPQGVEDAQKAQIRESFKRCQDSTKFKTKKWTVCLPVDLSVDEKRWFEEWRGKQAGSGIVIGDLWGATMLERLLYQAKNRGLREAFFKEEHLAQIRESHALLQRLLPDIAERLRLDAEDRERARRAEADARQVQAIVNEWQRQNRLIAMLRREYLDSHDGITPAMLAGREPLPKTWVESRLAEMGQAWRRGRYCEYDQPPGK
jgi:hypothetical protein